MPISDEEQEEQKRIFAKNLTYYLAINEKTQKQFANDMGLNTSTVNMWVKGKNIPQVSTIQKIADYFRIGKSDLVDEKLNSDADLDARIVSDAKITEMIRKFYALSVKDREAIDRIITSLYNGKNQN